MKTARKGIQPSGHFFSWYTKHFILHLIQSTYTLDTLDVQDPLADALCWGCTGSEPVGKAAGGGALEEGRPQFQQGCGINLGLFYLQKVGFCPLCRVQGWCV